MREKNRPLIGINTDFVVTARHKMPHSFMRSGYFDCIAASGGIPVLIPPLTKDTDLNPLLDRLDSVVLTGGDDLDPILMGQPNHPSVRKINERREKADRLLVRLCQQRKMPVLGIGLGMQELNVFMGGQLYVHLPEEYPRGLPHHDINGGVHRHVVHPVKGSLFEKIYGSDEMHVNSMHHMGIRKVAPCFHPVAHAVDGLVEAIAHTDEDWWCVGVQWHPEADGLISLDTQLLEAFVEASVSYRAKPMLKLAKAG
jgi:putative glutamine amidotransferase